MQLSTTQGGPCQASLPAPVTETRRVAHQLGRPSPKKGMRLIDALTLEFPPPVSSGLSDDPLTGSADDGSRAPPRRKIVRGQNEIIIKPRPLLEPVPEDLAVLKGNKVGWTDWLPLEPDAMISLVSSILRLVYAARAEREAENEEQRGKEPCPEPTKEGENQPIQILLDASVYGWAGTIVEKGEPLAEPSGIFHTGGSPEDSFRLEDSQPEPHYPETFEIGTPELTDCGESFSKASHHVLGLR